MLSGSIRYAGRSINEKRATLNRCASTTSNKLQNTKKGNSKVNLLSRTADQLIKGTKKARQEADWKHTYEKKGEQSRLADDVARRNQVKLGSKAQLPEDEVGEYGTVDEVLHLTAAEGLMQPGTFFELRR